MNHELILNKLKQELNNRASEYQFDIDTNSGRWKQIAVSKRQEVLSVLNFIEYLEFTKGKADESDES